MRTTVSLDDQVYDEARRMAFESRRTLGSVINELLAAGLKARRTGGAKRELGKLRGSIRIDEDFDHTPSDLVAAFEAEI